MLVSGDTSPADQEGDEELQAFGKVGLEGLLDWGSVLACEVC